MLTYRNKIAIKSQILQYFRMEHLRNIIKKSTWIGQICRKKAKSVWILYSLWYALLDRKNNIYRPNRTEVNFSRTAQWIILFPVISLYIQNWVPSPTMNPACLKPFFDHIDGSESCHFFSSRFFICLSLLQKGTTAVHPRFVATRQ